MFQFLIGCDLATNPMTEFIEINPILFDTEDRFQWHMIIDQPMLENHKTIANGQMHAV